MRPEPQGTFNNVQPVSLDCGAGFCFYSVVKVPVSENPPPASLAAVERPKFIIPTTEGFRPDWKALLRFHVDRSRDRSIEERRRRWHANQARQIAAKHQVQAPQAYSWTAHCAAALAALESEAPPLT